MVLMKKMVSLKYLQRENDSKNDFSYSWQYSDKP